MVVLLCAGGEFCNQFCNFSRGEWAGDEAVSRVQGEGGAQGGGGGAEEEARGVQVVGLGEGEDHTAADCRAGWLLERARWRRNHPPLLQDVRVLRALVGQVPGEEGEGGRADGQRDNEAQEGEGRERGGEGRRTCYTSPPCYVCKGCRAWLEKAAEFDRENGRGEWAAGLVADGARRTVGVRPDELLVGTRVVVHDDVVNDDGEA